MPVDLTFEPQPLQEWFDANNPDGKLIWKNGLADQVIFVRDPFDWLIRTMDFRERRDHPVRVVSTHRSKSVVLPVYEITTPEWELGRPSYEMRSLSARLRMRYNFFNWVVSVEVGNAGGAKDYFRDLFEREATVAPVYAEGFREDWVFGSYAEDRHKFTISLGSQYDLYTFGFLLRASG